MIFKAILAILLIIGIICMIMVASTTSKDKEAYITGLNTASANWTDEQKEAIDSYDTKRNTLWFGAFSSFLALGVVGYEVYTAHASTSSSTPTYSK